ncbi:ras-related protein RAB1BV-like [Lotus japonicus]|uniref:ras-related protein RAB1BV-like n=1 Tax=Lotus japonicus TaxID=34305 RepID=UPI00258B7922|nr:ras-related protein RAB1BV-like [Lotus japonicus]XP_057435287.1 ras-related protein RAB1BV-like [Lotus japonicus]XP_057435354.1 ras-related protein RAB1BV-like [Lotus japonicus]
MAFTTSLFNPLSCLFPGKDTWKIKVRVLRQWEMFPIGDSSKPYAINLVLIDSQIRTIDLDGKRIKLQIRDTAGQERFRTITIAYYRGAIVILVVYYVSDEASFNNIKIWICNIEQHASDNVNKILVGNKADMDESKKVVPTSKGQALAYECGIKFFETSAKTNLNVEEVFFSITRDIK